MKLAEKEINRLKKRYGKWALITGATSGIGRELALKLGEAGFNIVITGRREKLLLEVSNQLYDRHKTEVIPIPGDLSKMENVTKLMAETAHIPIGIAIMNAGFGTSGKFINSVIDQEVNMLDLNNKALLVLTHHFAKKMAQVKQGAIVLMSSMVAFQGVPNAAHYSATKAYVQTLGEALAVELKPEGVDILCAAPGPVESGFSKRANMRMGKALKPQDVGIPILKAIGKKTTVLPGWLTKVLVYNLSMTPRWAKIRIMAKVMAGFTKHQALGEEAKS